MSALAAFIVGVMAGAVGTFVLAVGITLRLLIRRAEKSLEGDR